MVIGGADGLHRLMKVTVLDIQGRNVRLGFEVDADVPVHRSEVWERICAERQTESRLEACRRASRHRLNKETTLCFALVLTGLLEFLQRRPHFAKEN